MNKEQIRNEIKKIVDENRTLLKNRFDFIPPTSEEINKMEEQLGIKLPEAYIWAWSIFGGGIGDSYISFGKDGFDVVEGTMKSWEEQKCRNEEIKYETDEMIDEIIDEVILEPKTYIVIEDYIFEFAIDIESGKMIEIATDDYIEKTEETYEMFILDNLIETIKTLKIDFSKK